MNYMTISLLMMLSQLVALIRRVYTVRNKLKAINILELTTATFWPLQQQQARLSQYNSNPEMDRLGFLTDVT